MGWGGSSVPSRGSKREQRARREEVYIQPIYLGTYLAQGRHLAWQPGYTTSDNVTCHCKTLQSLL